jgi:hypothetical protein
VTRAALRLAVPPSDPVVTGDAPVEICVAGRTPVDRLVRMGVERRVVALVSGGRRLHGVELLHGAARAPESSLEVLHLTAVGIGTRYLQAAAGRAAAAGWAPHEICCLVAEVERRMTAWVCGPRLALGRRRRPVGRRPVAVLAAGRWRPSGSGPSTAAELLDRGLARSGVCLAALSGPAGRWAEQQLDDWSRAGAVAGRLDRGLAHELGLRWTLELVVAPALTASGLSAIREQVAAAPRCGWCRLPVLGAACPRCAMEEA